MRAGSPGEELDQVEMCPEVGETSARCSPQLPKVFNQRSELPPPLGLSPCPTSAIAHQEFLPAALFTEDAPAPLRAPLLSSTEQGEAQECPIFLPMSQYSMGPHY